MNKKTTNFWKSLVGVNQLNIRVMLILLVLRRFCRWVDVTIFNWLVANSRWPKRLLSCRRTAKVRFCVGITCANWFLVYNNTFGTSVCNIIFKLKFIDFSKINYKFYFFLKIKIKIKILGSNQRAEKRLKCLMNGLQHN